MQKHSSSFFVSLRSLFRSKLLIGIFVILILGIGAYVMFGNKKPVRQLVTVKRGAITELVAVTGNTIPVQNVSLGFENSGTVAHVYAAVGNAVSAGRVLAELNTSDLGAQLLQAQASVSVEKAKLEGLKSGAQPEDIAASEAAFEKARQDLLNMYAGMSDASIDAAAKANDAVRTQLHTLFSNAETSSPDLTFDTRNSQSATDAKSHRIMASAALDKWQGEVFRTPTIDEDPALAFASNLSYLSTIRDLLYSVSVALDGAISVDATTLTTRKTSVATAIAEVNTATKNLNTIVQSIASQKLTVAQLKAQLELKKAGGSREEISAQEAQVEKALANVTSVEAKLGNSRIVAPISGTITQFDAKVGQLASPSVPLVSIIGNGGFEVDAGVSESDIGKIALGNKVTMTLDAFQGETFEGSVFYVAPANTNAQGVVNYQIKVSFDKLDTRLKSGLTANLNIQTRHKDDVLMLPQYALLQNDKGTFVEVFSGGVVKQVPVTLGLQDQNGNVEILSGVSEGEQVQNIGLKNLQ